MLWRQLKQLTSRKFFYSYRRTLTAFSSSLFLSDRHPSKHTYVFDEQRKNVEWTCTQTHRHIDVNETNSICVTVINAPLVIRYHDDHCCFVSQFQRSVCCCSSFLKLDLTLSSKSCTISIGMSSVKSKTNKKTVPNATTLSFPFLVHIYYRSYRWRWLVNRNARHWHVSTSHTHLFVSFVWLLSWIQKLDCFLFWISVVFVATSVRALLFAKFNKFRKWNAMRQAVDCSRVEQTKTKD